MHAWLTFFALPYTYTTPLCMYACIADTPISVVEEMFNSLTSRDDIGIILINQHVRMSLYPVGVCRVPVCPSIHPSVNQPTNQAINPPSTPRRTPPPPSVNPSIHPSSNQSTVHSTTHTPTPFLTNQRHYPITHPRSPTTSGTCSRGTARRSPRCWRSRARTTRTTRSTTSSCSAST